MNAFSERELRKEQNGGGGHTNDAQEIVTRRLAILEHGFLPIPLKDNKNPALKGWPKVVADEAQINDPYWQEFTNTGILTKETPVIDVDLDDATATKEIEALIRQRYADKGKILRRVGKPPKFAVPFRTDSPFKKKILKVWPPGAEDCQQIEILCNGQQTVVDGIHPKTKLPYTWSGGEPWTVERDELPELTSEEADAFLAAASEVLVALGWSVAPPKSAPKTAAEPRAGEEGEPGADAALIAALAVIPNNQGWEEWKQVGMRIWKRTNGSTAGLEAFTTWSRKSKKHSDIDDAEKGLISPNKAWGEMTNSPPTEYDADSILKLADEAAPGWRGDGGARRVTRKLPWREVTAKGAPKASYYNVCLGIVAMGIDCRHDLFRDVTIIGFKGDKVVHEVRPMIGELTNMTLLRLRHLFSERYGFDPEDKNIFDAVKTLAFENCFDPILDMLAEAEGNWDGKKRLDTWMIDYFGCKDTPLNRAIGRIVLIAAVHRARVPGCKYDYITVLEGPEGKDKSRAICLLAGDEFFSDQSILGARDKEIQEQLSGVWMHESADLTGLKKADVNAVKAFASRTTDRARPAYGRVTERKPRRSIDWATTNDEEYLQSQTGNRRFLPVAIGLILIEALKRDRLQLFGEAARAESAGESVMLPEALWSDAADAQEKRRTKDPWEDILADMGRVVPGVNSFEDEVIHIEGDQERVKTADLIDRVLKIPKGQLNGGHSMRLRTTMKRLGWERDGENKITIAGKQVRGYFRWIKRPDQGEADKGEEEKP